METELLSWIFNQKELITMDIAKIVEQYSDYIIKAERDLW